jgi:hypothetical protein
MTTRRLAAMLAADVVGFSKLMGEHEGGTLAALGEIRKQIVNPPGLMLLPDKASRRSSAAIFSSKASVMKL